MTVISSIQEAAPVIGMAVPATVYGSTDREHVEIGALAKEMAQRIAFDGHDWTRLKTLATITGDGTTTSFTLPADYRRMLKKARVWPSSAPLSPLTHYSDSDQWLGLQEQEVTLVTGAWTLIGASIHFLPALDNLETAKFYYVSSLIVDPVTGDNKTAFTIDTDSYLLDERVLKLGIIWQWKANKGLPYAEDMANYETALASRIGEDKGSNIIVVGRTRRLSPADVVSFPGTIPIP